MLPLCELCIEMGGRFNANRLCCQIRMIARMPKHARQIQYARARREGGRDEEVKLRDLVAAEWKRQTDPLRATGRAAIDELKKILGKQDGYEQKTT